MEVAKNALYQSVVRLPWVMHMKAYLLDGIRNIGRSKGEVLQSAG
jgi:hypothetical protein